MKNFEHSFIFNKYPNKLFDTVKYYVMFVGHGHSGHSLVGAILDAHPNIVISNELHVLPLFEQYGYDKLKVFKLILDNSINRALAQGWNNTGYTYNIPELYQGRYEKLSVLGDKKAGGTIRYSLEHPEVLNNLLSQFADSLKLIYVIRNPYDVISARAFRKGWAINTMLIKQYFLHVDEVLKYKQYLPPNQFYTLYHENFIHNTEKEINRVCSYLSQPTTAAYLKQCSSIIYASSHKRRYEIEWNDDNKALVKSLIQSKPYKTFLGNYEF